MRQPRPRSRPIFGRGGGGRGSFAAASGGGSGMLESSGLALLGPNELAGMAADFTTPAGSVYVRDPFTAANNVNTDRSWFTQSGTSPKLVRDGSGTYVWAGHNISRFSETFDDASWSKVAGSIVASATLPPSGYAKADKYVEDGTNAQHFVSKTEAGFIVGLPYTVTARLKPSGRTWCRFQFVNNFYFNMSGAGSVGTVSGGSGTITALADGWYLVTYTNTPSSTSTTGYIFAQTADNETSYTGDGASGFFVSGYQINRGSVPTAYVPTTTAAVYTLASDFHPTLGWGLLVEPAATNLCTYSNDYSNAAWVQTGTVGVAGSTLTKSLVEDAYIRNGAAAVVDSLTYTFSSLINKDNDETRFPEFIFRLDGGTPQEIYLSVNTKTGASAVRASTGTVSSAVVSVSATQWRVSLTVTNNATGNIVGRCGWRPALGTVLGVLNTAAVGSIVVEHAQLELGTVATSPIPTTTVSVTRAADNINKALSALPFSATAGSVIIDYSRNVSDGTLQSAAVFSDGTNNEQIQIRADDTTGSPDLSITDGGVGQTNGLAISNPGNDVRVRQGIAYELNNIANTRDGQVPVTDSAVTLPTVTTLYLGTRHGTSQILNGRIARLIYIPRRMSNTELQQRTA